MFGSDRLWTLELPFIFKTLIYPLLEGISKINMHSVCLREELDYTRRWLGKISRVVLSVHGLGGLGDLEKPGGCPVVKL